MVSVRNNNNNSYKTGYASVTEPTLGYSGGTSIPGNLHGTTSDITQPYNTPIGYLASTTKNITGIYDMSGGAWECVMGYNVNASVLGGKSEINSIYNDFFENSKWKKYYDKYSNFIEGDTSRYESGLLGDATRETGPFGDMEDPDKKIRHKTSWYKNYANFIYPAYPWFQRGGHWGDGKGSGIFAFFYSNGDIGSYSFRVVLAP